MTLAALRRELVRLRAEVGNLQRRSPAERVAAFARAFAALHTRVDPAADPGGLSDVPAGIEPPTPRWTPAKLGSAQYAYLTSGASLNVTAAGRRVFKTEALIRRTVHAAIATPLSQACGYLCAPTQQQAKDIHWDALKALTPRWALATQDEDRDISESELKIRLFNGAFVKVAASTSRSGSRASSSTSAG